MEVQPVCGGCVQSLGGDTEGVGRSVREAARGGINEIKWEDASVVKPFLRDPELLPGDRPVVVKGGVGPGGREGSLAHIAVLFRPHEYSDRLFAGKASYSVSWRRRRRHRRRKHLSWTTAAIA